VARTVRALPGLEMHSHPRNELFSARAGLNRDAMTRTPAALLCVFALVSVVGCSSADAAAGDQTTIAKRHAAERTPVAEQAERFAVRVCECEDTTCAIATGEEFVAFRERTEIDARDEDAIDRIAERIRNCQAIAKADAQ
jgi:hypothetical protein